MDTDLIARLREAAHYADEYEGERELWNEAADALEAQARRITDLRKESDMMHSEYKTARARIAELEAALKPFADEAQSYHPIFKDEELAAENTFDFTIGDLRAASAALGEKE